MSPVRTDLPTLPAFVGPGAVLQAAERGARAGASDAGAIVTTAIAGRAPSRTGAAAASVQARVRATATGITLRVAPNDKPHPAASTRSASRTIPNSLVWRFIEKGTGVYGPAHRVIAKKHRGLVAAGAGVVVPSGRGFAGRHIFDAVADDLDASVLAVMEQGVTVAVRELVR